MSSDQLRPLSDPSPSGDRVWAALPASQRFLLAVLLFAALTAVVTFPLVLHMRDGIADRGDPLLNTWALAWIAHQLPYAPAHVFDANIFHPEKWTLAYSETLLAPALVGAPFLWLGATPIGVYNFLLFWSFTLSGAGVALVVHHLTGSRWAAVISGAMFAFLPFRFDHFSHFQLLQTQWMPLALWYLHRSLERARLRDGVGLGVTVGLQVLTSVYNALFLGTLLAVVGVVVVLAKRPTLAQVRTLAIGVGVAAVLSVPVGIAHLNARKVVGERGRDEILASSAQLTDYLATVEWNRMHGSRAARFGGPERRLFPGAAAIGLSVVALWPPVSAVRVAYGAAVLVAVELSRGGHGLVYPWLYDHLLAFRSIRAPSRMGLIVGLALSVLAGFGVVRLMARLPRAAAVGLASLLLAVVIAESWVAPMGFTTVPNEVPEIYADLLRDRGLPTDPGVVRQASDPGPVVLLELPLNTESPTYMFYSTYHWQTLVNGYSGFFSPRYGRVGEVLQTFPDAGSIGLLKTLQVRYVTLHEEYMGRRTYARLCAALDRLAPSFRLVNRRSWMGREISLYRFQPS